jgi:hypothetical protein
MHINGKIIPAETIPKGERGRTDKGDRWRG